MTYVVWVNHGTEGFVRSDDFETLDEVLNFIAKETYGHDYEVTKLVGVQLIETSSSNRYPGVTIPGVGIGMHHTPQGRSFTGFGSVVPEDMTTDAQ